jgi:putative tricarboxylic transport membrane protein
MKESERITAIILAGGGVVIMYYAWNTLKIGSIHVPDAGFLPFLCGAALVILGIVWTLTLQGTKSRDDEGPAEKRLWQRPVLSVVLMVIYAWAIEALGYVTSTLVFMVVWQKLIEHERWVKTALVSLFGTLAMYLLFVYFLKVPIPQELFLR